MARTANAGSFKERVGALRNLWPFLATVWDTSPGLTVASLVLRVFRALLPVVTLYIAKLMIDDVVLLVQAPDRPATPQAWLASGKLNWLTVLLLGEFALAVLADLLGRLVTFLDSLLSERVTNASSIRLMEHAATLDLEDFEDAEFQDQLERARRQTSGRMALMSQLFGQAQDMVTVMSLAAGLVLFAPWLIALLMLTLVPAFLGEAHFNAQSYSLDFGRTPEQRELDYMREAEVLILDEPTAALDARAEFEVFQRFKELSKGKTGVLISHRFSSVRMADRMLVLADGKVEAAGTHDELVAQHGRYAELFELQAAGYS